MAYVKNTWVDREGQTRYHETIDDDGALIFTPDYEKVTELGTPVNADNMNHIEDGIVEHENRITVLEDANNASNFLNKSQITNCLLEVPQRIKYTYENGTFTLKAGSQVIVPNGVGKFDYVTIANDMSVSKYSAGNSDCVMFYNSAAKTFNFYVLGLNIFSGTSTPTVTDQWNIWYDTANNIIKKSNDTGSTWYTHDMASFPIAILSRSAGNFTALKQVFNGMGYIGSTVWADKDIKALIPNGRNEDGTLNNIEVVTDSVKTITESVNTNAINESYVLLTENGNLGLRGVSGSRYYDPESNYFIVDGVKYTQAIIATKTYQNAQTLTLNVKQPFHAVDYNEVVHKTGDTMTGKLKIVDADLTVANSGFPTIHIENSTFDYTTTTAPSSWLGLNRIIARDKNSKAYSYIQTAQETDGALSTTYATQRSVSGTTKTCSLVLGVNPDGGQYVGINGKTLQSFVIQSYKNGTSWYRVYSDGWCEQGGQISIDSSKGEVTVSLLKTFKDTNYHVDCAGYVTTGYNDTAYTLQNASYWGQTTSSFKVYCIAGLPKPWCARGYIS